jgi:hypothetical protein
VVGAGVWAKTLVKAYNTAAAVNEATVLIMLIPLELGLNIKVYGLTKARAMPQIHQKHPCIS